MRNEKGFTLIEIVMVLVLLGILAAVAIPKYLDLATSARKASVDGLAGGVAGAMAIAHAACLMDTTTPCVPTAATSTTTISGVTVNMVYGYPAATALGITAAMDFTPGKFTFAAGPPATYTIQANCLVTYTAAANATTSATVATTETGC